MLVVRYPITASITKGPSIKDVSEFSVRLPYKQELDTRCISLVNLLTCAAREGRRRSNESLQYQ